MSVVPVIRALAVAALTATVATPNAMAETEIRFSAGVAPKHVVNANGIEPWIKAVEKASGGQIKVRNFTGGQLLSVQGALAGVKSGLADGSVYPFPFYPAEYPIEKLISDIILGYGDTVVLASAMTEFALLACPDCQKAYADQNMVLLSKYATTPYVLISRRPIRTVEDMRAKKIRTAGASLNKVFGAMGAQGVAIDGGDMYQALSSGVLDGVMQAVGAFRSYSLWDAAKYYTDMPVGSAHTSPAAFNATFWKGLAPEQRKIIVETISITGLGGTLGYIQGDREVEIEARSKGVTVQTPSPDLQRRVGELIAAEVEAAIQQATTAGVRDAAGKAKTLQALVDKWDKLVAGKHDLADLDALVAIWNREIMAKIPVTSYGL